MPGFDIPARPVLVVIGVGKPVVKVRGGLMQERKIVQGQMLKPYAQVINRADQLPELIRRRVIFPYAAHGRMRRKTGQRPTGVKPEGKGAALIRPALVIVEAVIRGRMALRWGGALIAASHWVAPT